MFDLTGKSALVTGATGGIGEAVARALYARGAAVALSGRRVEKLEALAADLGDRAVVAPCDLSDLAAVDALPKQAEEALGDKAASGGLDILIANAGVTKDNIFMRMKVEEWDDVIATNLTSYFRLSKACLRGMMKRRFGRIVGVTSVVGVTGNPGQGNYAASKAGMIGMSKSLAQEVASRGVTVNCVAPGFIKTAMTDVLTEEQQSQILPRIPAGAMGAPDDVAAAIVYLSSGEGGYVTGQTLHVNGGMAMI
ncbi:MAG: 3-oxoacyl-[acyl-carrier-protein] reductase [Pseudomonadota bacterium]